MHCTKPQAKHEKRQLMLLLMLHVCADADCLPGRLTLACWASSGDAVLLCCLALQEHYFAIPEPGKLAARINWRINKPNGDFIERSVVQVCCLWGLPVGAAFRCCVGCCLLGAASWVLPLGAASWVLSRLLCVLPVCVSHGLGCRAHGSYD